MKINSLVGFVLVCGLGLVTGVSFGQLPGGGAGGIDTGGSGFQTIPTTGQAGQGQQGQGRGSQTSRSNEAQQIDPRQAVQLPPQTDFRNQGFVGATSNKVQQLGYVGAASNRSGPPLSQGQSFGGSAGGGGGRNSGTTGGRTTGGTGGLGNSLTGGTGSRGLTNTAGGNRTTGANTFGGNRQGQTGGQFGGNQFGGNQFGGNQFGGGQGGQNNRNGFQVTRTGLRGQVTPNFASTASTATQVTQQFNTSFSRLPENQNFGGQYEVNVSGKKAVVSGWVNNQSESDRLIAQLRLQPGIYEVENKLEVRSKEE